MTKAELVEDVARAAELTKKDAERLVEIVFESIIDTLNQGEKIELRGFGSFRVRERGARRGRNPKTGDPVDIPAKRVPYFKPGKELKELINEEENGAGGAEDSAAAANQPQPDLGDTNPPNPDARAADPPGPGAPPSGAAETAASEGGEAGGGQPPPTLA
jgi:integration host factor subunit beta